MNLLPKDPPKGLLHSMAIRYDHGLAIPDYYNQELFKGTPSHEERYKVAIIRMGQLYEEVSGHGFYKWNDDIDC